MKDEILIIWSNKFNNSSLPAYEKQSFRASAVKDSRHDISTVTMDECCASSGMSAKELAAEWQEMNKWHVLNPYEPAPVTPALDLHLSRAVPHKPRETSTYTCNAHQCKIEFRMEYASNIPSRIGQKTINLASRTIFTNEDKFTSLTTSVMAHDTALLSDSFNCSGNQLNKHAAIATKVNFIHPRGQIPLPSWTTFFLGERIKLQKTQTPQITFLWECARTPFPKRSAPLQSTSWKISNSLTHKTNGGNSLTYGRNSSRKSRDKSAIKLQEKCTEKLQHEVAELRKQLLPTISNGSSKCTI